MAITLNMYLLPTGSARADIFFEWGRAATCVHSVLDNNPCPCLMSTQWSEHRCTVYLVVKETRNIRSVLSAT